MFKLYILGSGSECNSLDLALAAMEWAVRETGFGHVNVRLTYADGASDLVEYQRGAERYDR